MSVRREEGVGEREAVCAGEEMEKREHTDFAERRATVILSALTSCDFGSTLRSCKNTSVTVRSNLFRHKREMRSTRMSIASSGTKGLFPLEKAEVISLTILFVTLSINSSSGSSCA